MEGMWKFNNSLNFLIVSKFHVGEIQPQARNGLLMTEHETKIHFYIKPQHGG